MQGLRAAVEVVSSIRLEIFIKTHANVLLVGIMIDKYDFKAIEESLVKHWQDQKTYSKVKEKSSKAKQKWYFLHGPPYTSGRIHIGHAWNNSLKDVIIRYKRMKGFKVWDRFGYDMHGLPTENKVQQELKLTDKKAIIRYGLKKFIKRK